MIRPFGMKDADACCELIHACIRYDLEMPPAQRELLLRSETPQAMVERSGLFYVVVWESEDSVAGIGGLELNEIRLLYVSPAHQRRGIGGALLDHLEAMVPPALFKDVFVYAAPSAAGFYRTRGYESRGEHLFEAAGHMIPTIFMNKRLFPAAT